MSKESYTPITEVRYGEPVPSKPILIVTFTDGTVVTAKPRKGVFVDR